MKKVSEDGNTMIHSGDTDPAGRSVYQAARDMIDYAEKNEFGIIAIGATDPSISNGEETSSIVTNMPPPVLIEVLTTLVGHISQPMKDAN